MGLGIEGLRNGCSQASRPACRVIATGKGRRLVLERMTAGERSVSTVLSLDCSKQSVTSIVSELNQRLRNRSLPDIQLTDALIQKLGDRKFSLVLEDAQWQDAVRELAYEFTATAVFKKDYVVFR